MFGKDKCFAFEKFRPDYVWTGERWTVDRRQSRDKRLGRRHGDAYFPYAPAFVVQSLAQGMDMDDENGRRLGHDSTRRYSALSNAGSGRYLKLKI